jgi:hypothetical protein
MKNKRMVKLLALAMSMTLVLQPVAVFAEDNYNEPVVAAIENAEKKVEAALPSEEPSAEEPAAETPAEEAAPEIIAQEPTDTHLENTAEALEKIDDTITAYNNVLDASEEIIEEADKDYRDAVKTAKESEGEFEQAAADAANASIPAIIDTALDAYDAYEDANQVEEMAGETYETQAEAETAKEEATGIAAQAQAAADDAAAVVKELGEKVTAAEDAKDQADADYQAAEAAYNDAVDARKEAEAAYNKIVKQYGLDNWFYNPDAQYEFFGSYGKGDVRTAIVEAKAALESAKSAEEQAKSDYDGKKKDYDDAKDIYDKAVEDAQKAQGELADAEAALDKATLVEAINAVRADEIKIYNWYRNNYYGQGYIKVADTELAKSLVEYALYEEDIKGADISVVNGKIVAKYTDKNGEAVERTFDYNIDPELVNIGDRESAHWLLINEYKDVEEEYTDYRVVDAYKDESGNEVEDISEYTDYGWYRGRHWYYKETTQTVVIPGHYEVRGRNIYWVEEKTYEEEVTIWAYKTTKTEEYTSTRTVNKPVDYYTEYAYWTATKDITKDGAQAVVDGINDRINKPGTMEDDLADKLQAATDAENAQAAAGTKLDAVKEAHKAVIDAAKMLENLERVEKVSYVALAEVKKHYYEAVADLAAAEVAYRLAAFNAGIAQYEADRALAALDNGFDYIIPTPTPEPEPTPAPVPTPTPAPTPSDDTTTDDVPAYIPVVPVAVTPAPAAPAPAAPAPQAAVLGATRTGNGSAASTAAVVGDGKDEIKADASAAEDKHEEVQGEKKPVVAIEEEETAKAAAPISEQTPFPWWVLIILAAITALSIEEYARRRKAIADNQR